jgi:hypothetical protein
MTAGRTHSLGTVCTALATALVRCVNRAGGTVVNAILMSPSVIRAYLNRGDVLRMLDMDDRMLRDIGITRADITSSLAGPYSCDPSTRLRIFAVERRAGVRAQARERLAALDLIETQLQLPLPSGADPMLEVK